MIPAMSDRWVAAVQAAAREAFGSGADRWLDAPNANLAGRRPADLMFDRMGAQMVLTVLRTSSPGQS